MIPIVDVCFGKTFGLTPRLQEREQVTLYVRLYSNQILPVNLMLPRIIIVFTSIQRILHEKGRIGIKLLKKTTTTIKKHVGMRFLFMLIMYCLTLKK